MISKLSQTTQEHLRTSINIPTFDVAIAEFVYNSIDARSTAISVSIDPNSLSLEIRDNGDGISSTDLSSVFSRHSTSKVEVEQNNNKTHGFRGEFLASVAWSSLSVTLTSRFVGSFHSFTRTVHEGVVGNVEQAEQARSVGTTISVISLFHKFPVRKTSAISDTNIAQTVKTKLESIAIAHPNIVFSLFDSSSGTKLLGTSRRNNMLETFLDFHEIDKHSLRSLDALPDKDYHWTGYVSIPIPPGNPSKELQFLYINRRFVEGTKFHRVVNKIYKRSGVLEEVRRRARFPIFVLSLDCPETVVDFTFEPAKAIVEFSDWETPLKLLELSIVKAIHGKEALPKDIQQKYFGLILTSTSILNDEDEENKTEDEDFHEPEIKQKEKEEEELQATSTTTAITNDQQKQRKIWKTVSEPNVFIHRLTHFLSDSSFDTHSDNEETSTTVVAAATTTTKPTTNGDPPIKRRQIDCSVSNSQPTIQESENSLQVLDYSQLPNYSEHTLKKEVLAHLKVLNQLDNKFILAVNDEGIVWAFDQHAVHERIQLEQFEKEIFGNDGMQRSVSHKICDYKWDFSSTEISRVEKHFQHLTDWGFEITVNKDATCGDNKSDNFLHVWKIPVILGNALKQSDLCEFLLALEESSGLQTTIPPAIPRILATKACRSAIKFGQTLSVSDCAELLKLLSTCKAPFQCAHGRPNVSLLMSCSVLHSITKKS